MADYSIEFKTQARNRANEIAELLGETEFGVSQQIYRMIKKKGQEFVEDRLREAQEIETKGGLMLPDGSRRRTPGGVFFFTVRQHLSPEEIKFLFFYRPKNQRPQNNKPETQPTASPSAQPTPKSKTKPSHPAPSLQPTYPSFVWDERETLLHDLIQTPGVVSTVKITLIGRPGKIEKRDQLVITSMEHQSKNPAMPKGVPSLPSTPTLYTVYIAMKQWKKVEEAIQNPEDILIIEGFAAFEPLINGIAVFTQNVSTKLLDQAKRQPQKQTKEAADTQSVPETPVNDAASTPPAPAVAPSEIPAQKSDDTKYAEPIIPANVPKNVEIKLKELYSALSQFQQKLAALDKKPANQRFGYEMTQKLLQNTQQQIDALLKQYS